MLRSPCYALYVALEKNSKKQIKSDLLNILGFICARAVA